ncbi:MAG: monofunctional biosynthetic peptidoglycan transglycosylase [Chitinispirillia bacterium]|nr:monofunctional biosynthetic peptidoglycan transglycosylase [Chitinispirillia bacterium]
MIFVYDLRPVNYYFKAMTNSADNQNPNKKLPLILRILIGIYIVIRTIFVAYAVIFAIAGTIAIYLGYTHGRAYFDNHLMKPINDVKQLITENPTESAYMKQYREQLREAGECDSLIWKFVPLDSIADILKQTVLAAEDDGFYTHPGFSLDAIVEAIERNRTSNSFRSGASTITQQVAKNFFLTPEKSFERKFMEIGYALLMEKYLGKDRILELYLNYAQWGKNVFGCEAAANVYFRKSSANLTRTEAARMAATLAMPARITPHHTKSGFMARRIAVIANNMYIRGQLDDAGYFSLTGEHHPNAEQVLSDTE